MEMNISRYRTLKALQDRLAKCQAEVLQVYKAEGMGMQNMTLAALAERTAKDYREAVVPDRATDKVPAPPVDVSVEKQVDAMVAEAAKLAAVHSPVETSCPPTVVAPSDAGA